MLRKRRSELLSPTVEPSVPEGVPEDISSAWIHDSALSSADGEAKKLRRYYSSPPFCGKMSIGFLHLLMTSTLLLILVPGILLRDPFPYGFPVESATTITWGEWIDQLSPYIIPPFIYAVFLRAGPGSPPTHNQFLFLIMNLTVLAHGSGMHLVGNSISLSWKEHIGGNYDSPVWKVVDHWDEVMSHHVATTAIVGFGILAMHREWSASPKGRVAAATHNAAVGAAHSVPLFISALLTALICATIAIEGGAWMSAVPLMGATVLYLAVWLTWLRPVSSRFALVDHFPVTLHTLLFCWITLLIIGAYAYAVGPHMPQPSELNMFPHIKTDADGRPYIDWGANDLH